MSMTLINFVRKTELPTKIELENKIKDLGYDFEFLTDFEKLDHLNQIDSIECRLNGTKILIEIYFDPLEEIISDFPELKNQLTNKDLGISFISGSDQLVSACINIISIGLIDLCKSIVFYADDAKIYSRDMLIQDTSESLDHIKKQMDSISKVIITEHSKYKEKKKKESINHNIIDILLLGLLLVSMILKNKNLISWYIPILLFAFVLIKSIIQHNKRKKI